MDERFLRNEMLWGKDGQARLTAAHVIVFGLGGVGSYAVEALARSGIGELTLVDRDTLSPSNINRQLMATTQTIGQSKVEVLRKRLLAINPEADITATSNPYNKQTACSFDLNSYDYVIDAIDSLHDKALLILDATSAHCCFVSSMGAALKTDPQKIKVSEFWKVEGCPLARALRKRFKRTGLYPYRKFMCVYSPEVLPNKGEPPTDISTSSYADPMKAQINGSMAHITAIFGFTLAGLVVNQALETDNDNG